MIHDIKGLLESFPLYKKIPSSVKKDMVFHHPSNFFQIEMFIKIILSKVLSLEISHLAQVKEY